MCRALLHCLTYVFKKLILGIFLDRYYNNWYFAFENPNSPIREGRLIKYALIATLTCAGVSLFSITCSRWGGRIGGPLCFSPGFLGGTSWQYSPEGDPGVSTTTQTPHSITPKDPRFYALIQNILPEYKINIIYHSNHTKKPLN